MGNGRIASNDNKVPHRKVSCMSRYMARVVASKNEIKELIDFLEIN